MRSLLSRSAWIFAAVAAMTAASCDAPEEEAKAPCVGANCGAVASASVGTSGGGAPVPDCRGEPMPAGDLVLEDDGRTARIACPGALLSLSVVDDAILRLRYRAEGDPENERASYAVAPGPASATQAFFGSTEDDIRVCTPSLFASIRLSDCHLRALDAAGSVVMEDPEAGGFFQSGAKDRGVSRLIAEGEHFYGFGEKTGPLDKRGRSMTFWNTDAYDATFGGYAPDADPLYQSVPFFVGLRDGVAYGVFVDNTFRMRFDMGETDPKAFSLSSEGGEIDQYLIAGPSIRDVVRGYARLTGTLPLPPRWALGYHQSRWGYASQDEVVSVAQELRNRGLPADAMWLDIQHMDGFRSFTWDPANYGNPAALSSALAALHFHAVAIVDPGLKVDPSWDVYAEALAGGHFLGSPPYVGEVWPGDASFPDFSSPAARAFWGSLVSRTLDPGVSGLWIDMNEPSNFVSGQGGTVPSDLAAEGDGVPSTMAELHNVYAHNEARATYEGMKAALGGERPFLLTRAGYAGTQRYAAVWTGDAPSTFETLRGTLPMLLGMGLSGIAFAGSDVGGYSGGASPELFARWMQLGAVSPFFRGHVTSGVPPQEPYLFGTEVEDITRQVASLRYSLLPYLYSLFHEASVYGDPILRPLVYAFQDDPEVAAIGDQAMLGPFLLIAPVLDEGASSRMVTFPKGRWFELRSGAIIEGPITASVEVTLGALPIYVREGATIPTSQPMQWADEAPIDPLTLDLYPSETPSSFSLYEDDGHSFAYQGGNSSEVTYTLARTDDGATLTVGPRKGSFVPPARTLLLRVRRVDSGAAMVTLGGVALPEMPSRDALLASGHGYWNDARDLSLLVAATDTTDVAFAFTYDPKVIDPAPPVSMEFRVTVPAGTSTLAPITIASSASGWAHQPLSWTADPQVATGFVDVPRGQWLYYKYARGDWSTVEKYPGCVEAENRYELGAAHPIKNDTVFQWADACP